MGTIQQGAVYDTLIDLLIQCCNREEILKFRLGTDAQTRLDQLLDKNRNGTINLEEASELETFEQFEHVVRLLKARMLQRPES